MSADRNVGLVSDRTMNRARHAGERVADDLRAVIADGEELMSAAAASGEGIAAAREKFQRRLEVARDALERAAQPVTDQAAAAARATQECVAEHPWAAVGVAAFAGLVIGLLALKRPR